MKVLVIGGTGFIGRAVVRRLRADGHEVAIFTRGRTRPEFGEDVESIVGDRKEPDQFRRSLGGREFDVVVDNVAYDSVSVRSAIEAFAGRIRHYLLCSSGAVYRDYDDLRQCVLVREEDADLKHRGDGSYPKGKREAEQELWSLPRDGRTFAFTVIRPSVVEGPEDLSGRTWYWIQRVSDGGPVLVPHTVPFTIFRHAYVEDVAMAFLQAADNPKAFGKAYNVASDEILALDDYVRSVSSIVGGDPLIVSSRLSLLRSLPGLSDFGPPFVGERFVMDISRIKQDLGWRPTPTSEWLRRTVSWFLDSYSGPDSDSYSNRPAEVTAARTLSGTT